MTPQPAKSIVVVSNTSPLYYATRIGHLDLLRQLYGNILIPEQVYAELGAGIAGKAVMNQIYSSRWIIRKSVRNRTFVADLQKELDAGESEAIALAKEIRANLLLLDEHRGRKIADREGLKKTGIIGVLLDAKRTHLVTEIKPLLDKLFQDTNFHGSRELYQQALALAGE